MGVLPVAVVLLVAMPKPALGQPQTCAGITATIVGTEGPDVIIGTPGDDVIVALGGDDVIHAGGGHDVICGGSGNDVIYGGDGPDLIYGDEGNDRLFGEAGDDAIHGGEGDDFIDGGEGDDRGCPDDAAGVCGLHGGPGNDEIHGGPGIDLIYGDEGNDRLFGEAGQDAIHGGEGDDFIDGGEGDDGGCGEGVAGVCGLHGGPGNDEIHGGPGIDLIYGEAGDDRLFGEAGWDAIHGGEGNDYIDGGEGDDGGCPESDASTNGCGLHGGPGNDEIHGGAGMDLLYGEAGDDRLFGEAGWDAIYGGEGNDFIDGGEGDDKGCYGTGPAGTNGCGLRGGPGNDEIHGGPGMDLIYGEAGDDRLFGEAGWDAIYGGEGNDFIDGGEGDDEMDGGDGVDQCTGGAGKDSCDGGPPEPIGADAAECGDPDVCSKDTEAHKSCRWAGTPGCGNWTGTVTVEVTGSLEESESGPDTWPRGEDITGTSSYTQSEHERFTLSTSLTPTGEQQSRYEYSMESVRERRTELHMRNCRRHGAPRDAPLYTMIVKETTSARGSGSSTERIVFVGVNDLGELRIGVSAPQVEGTKRGARESHETGGCADADEHASSDYTTPNVTVWDGATYGATGRVAKDGRTASGEQTYRKDSYEIKVRFDLAR